MKPLNIIQAYNRKKMFKGDKRVVNYLFGGLDIIFSLVFFILAFLIVKNTSPDEDMEFDRGYQIFTAFLIPVSYILLQTTNLARMPRTSRNLAVFFDFVRFSIALSIISFIGVLVFRLNTVSFNVLALYFFINHFGLFFIRMFTYKFFKNYRASGHNVRNVLVIADDKSIPVIEKMLHNREWGFRILMILTNSSIIREKYAGQLRIIPDKINIRSIIDFDIIDEVIYSSGKVDSKRLNYLVKSCEEVGVVFRFQNDLAPISLFENGVITELEEIPMLTVMNTPSNQIAVAWKTLTESVFVFCVMFVLSPLLALIAVAIKLDSPGPAIFKQKRVGLRGRKFYIYKFRTMVTNAEELKAKLETMNESDGPTFKMKKDPRITRIGRFLRKTSLDELPQLFNVIRGEMSLIGPRPPIPSEVEQYERWHLRRLSVKPGLTCTWQIIPNRNDVVFEKWMKLDLKYIDSWSLKQDFNLIFKTIKAVFTNSGY